MRVNASGASVPEKTKYQLAQSLCSAAGSGQHIVEAAAVAANNAHDVPNHIFNYATLNSWMDALRHQRPVAEWDDALHDRLRVLPGLTGMWQVSGRSESSFAHYKRMDLYYVDNWSLAHDLRICTKTVKVVLTGRGAT